MRQTLLAKRGLDWPKVEAIADWYKISPVTVYRYALGRFPWETANPGMLRSMLHFGWEPIGGATALRKALDARSRDVMPGA